MSVILGTHLKTIYKEQLQCKNLFLLDLVINLHARI
jgi:hypothetical protein